MKIDMFKISKTKFPRYRIKNFSLPLNPSLFAVLPINIKRPANAACSKGDKLCHHLSDYNFLYLDQTYLRMLAGDVLAK